MLTHIFVSCLSSIVDRNAFLGGHLVETDSGLDLSFEIWLVICASLAANSLAVRPAASKASLWPLLVRWKLPLKQQTHARTR